MPRPPTPSTSPRLTDRTVYLALIILTLAIRVPLFPRLDFITYDGTYYIGQARALLRGQLSGGSFPIGYPLLVAPVLAVVRDGVLAGALVSLAAAVGSVMALYALGRQFVGRTDAAIGAGVLAATPLFIQVSMLVLSESAYICWLLLALVSFGGSRFGRAGLAIGAAAATRPEGVAVAGLLGSILAIRWLRRRVASRVVVVFAAGAAVVYGVSVTALSIESGRLAFLSRTQMYGSKAAPWELREATVEYAGRESAEATTLEAAGPVDRIGDYLHQMPRAVGRLGGQMLPFLPLLALVGMARRRTFVLTAFAPILIIPLFIEERGILRWILPYVPPLILYGMIGLRTITRKWMKLPARIAVVVCALLAVFIHRDVVTGGLERDMMPVRAAGREFAPRVSPGDRIADRKPYFAFYAGGSYVEIPFAPYDEAIGALARSGVRYLSLFQPMIHNLRPAMRPLLYDRAAITGELRYRQVLLHKSGAFVYERVRDSDPLNERPLMTRSSEAGAQVDDMVPVWSPHGGDLAFRRVRKGSGRSAICVLDTQRESVRTVAVASEIADFLTWSPDGRRVAYADDDGGNLELFAVDQGSGEVARLTRSTAHDYAPSWCAATGEIFFVSERGGAPAVWVQPGGGGAATRVSAGDGPVDRPGASPSGVRVAWTDEAGRLVLCNRRNGDTVTVGEPRGIVTAPSWSPDERVIAVAAVDWGSANVYLISTSDGRALRLTKQATGRTMPTWAPGGAEIAAVAIGLDNRLSIVRIGNLAAYIERLSEGTNVAVLRRP